MDDTAFKRNLAIAVAALLASGTPAFADSAPPAALGVQLAGEDGGLTVREVMPGNTAAALGMEAGDELLAIGDTPVPTLEAVLAHMKTVKAGASISVTVRRGGRDLKLSGTALPRPAGLQPGVVTRERN